MSQTDLEAQLQAMRQALEQTRQQLVANPALTPEVVEASLAPLRRQVAALEAQVQATTYDQREQRVGQQFNIALVNELPRSVLELFARQFGFAPAASDAEALKAYFKDVIFERHSKLSFLFIRPETGKVYTERDIDIETIFVPLRMTDLEAVEQRGRLARRLERFERLSEDMEETARPVTLPEVLKKYSCFLLRGKPGCGKTTLLRHIALAFARGEQREKLGWEGPVPLPLLVSLRNFGAFLKSKIRDGRYVESQPRALLEYLEEHLRGASVLFSADFLPRRLEAGQCFLLLDALDEASGELDGGGDLRATVARQVAAFIRHYKPKGNRFALTSRPRAYQEEGAIRRALRQPKVCDVLDLDLDGYRQLITNLLVVLTGDAESGRGEAGDLVGRITPNRQLTDLAGNPLLCTTLVLVYKYRGRKLPERRVDVLHEIVTLLLGRWEEERDVFSPEDLVREGTTARTTEQAIQFRRRALVALAWQMQQASTAEISAAEAVETLARFYCDEERTDEVKATAWARDFLRIAHERSGLFIAAEEGVHTFSHQAFREYLATTHLVNAGEAHLLETVWQHAPTPDEWWEQVVLFAGAHPELSSGASGRLIEKLLEAGDLAYAHLAARCARDMTDKLPGPQRKRLQDWLMCTMQDETRPAKERALAGRALALAGDPRPGVGLRPDGLPEVDWREVPAGPFLMGGQTYGDEKPQHEQDIPTPYCVSRYPITNAQYAAFVRAGGYKTRRYWTAAGWDWRERKGVTSPRDYGELFNLPNHPVVGVAWYEALAFCRWLTERLRETGDLGSDGQVKLPSEAEWEKASRGTSGWAYPWGNEWDETKCNTTELSLEGTTPVGIFPEGASPYGCLDMAGNVWEWTRSLWGKDWGKPEFRYPYDPEDGLENLGADDRVLRVLRGGSFLNTRNNARCACRRRNDPGRDWSHNGFRIVVSPISPSSAL